MPGADLITLVPGPGQQATQTAKFNAVLTVATAATVVNLTQRATWLQGALVTATASSQTAITFYDSNITTATLAGNVIGIIPASATANGVPYVFNAPAANGITYSGGPHNPAVTLFYS